VTRSQILFGWFLSLVLVVITAGQSWGSFEVSQSAGGGVINISGLQAFPVIGTLASLQLLLILSSLLVKAQVTRIMCAGLLPLMLWNFFEVLMNYVQRIQGTLITVLSEQTGVVEELATSEFLVSSSIGVFSLLFLVAAGINALVLAGVALLPPKKGSAKARQAKQRLPEDLWSSQT